MSAAATQSQSKRPSEVLTDELSCPAEAASA